MNPGEDRSGIMDLVHGDAASARDLRANLAVFARRSGSPRMHRLVSEVLAGRRNVREVLRSKEFNDVGSKRLARVEQGIAQLTDEQRAELFDPDRERTPAEALDALRDRHASLPGNGSAATGDDDADFSESSIYEP
jgi:hypothetical protein